VEMVQDLQVGDPLPEEAGEATGRVPVREERAFAPAAGKRYPIKQVSRALRLIVPRAEREW